MFSIATDSKTRRKDSDLFDILYSHFGKTINLARIRFMALMVSALCKMQTVSFGRLALAFGGAAEASSNMRRIQRFMSGYALDLSLVARLIFRLLPHDGPYTLSMDRTNWQFGGFKINALVLGVTYEGVAFPLLFRLLPKKGNSNTVERIALIERYIALFGEEDYAIIDTKNRCFEAPSEEGEALIAMFSPSLTDDTDTYYCTFSEILQMLRRHTGNPQLKPYNLQTAMRRYSFFRRSVRKERFNYPVYLYPVKLTAAATENMVLQMAQYK